MSRHARWVQSFQWPFDLQSAELQFAACKNEKIYSEPSSGSCLWWKWQRGHRVVLYSGRQGGHRHILLFGSGSCWCRSWKDLLELSTSWSAGQGSCCRDVWERWVQLLPLMFDPGPAVTVDERLVPFRRKTPLLETKDVTLVISIKMKQREVFYNSL